MSGGELSGVDMARVALRAALETAGKNGGNTRTTKAKPRTMSVVRRRVRPADPRARLCARTGAGRLCPSDPGGAQRAGEKTEVGQ